ncbi:MAG: hypothetical protein HGA38_02620 [Candidatus Moranbacteria bacterium]|nr:hypothetical protein [Candidatus Moranbacteria bacterium]NTW46369.1 hypothetical protein [Candidatus Moranbacteria bacterium]
MLNTDITDNMLGGIGSKLLCLKVFTETPSVPAGTHRYLASGQNGSFFILVTECDGMPYLFEMRSDAFETLQLPRIQLGIHDGVSEYFVVTNRDGESPTIARCDVSDQAMNAEPVEVRMADIRLHALARLSPNSFRWWPFEDNKTPNIAAVSQAKSTPFIVLTDPTGSGDYPILFVPREFSDTTEWKSVQDNPRDYELRLLTAKCMRMPAFRKKKRP